VIEYYGKDGEPLPQEIAWRLFEDMEYKRVDSTDVGPYWVSTVWLGLDHRFMGDGPPLIFETMVFLKAQRDDPGDHGLADIDVVRYSTLQQAQEGHQAMVLLVRATLDEEIPTEAPEGCSGPKTPPEGPDVAFFVAYDGLNTL